MGRSSEPTARAPRTHRCAQHLGFRVLVDLGWYVSTQHPVAKGASILKPLVTEPWGQRRVQVAGPDGLVIELVQPVEPDPDWMAAQGLSG
jgi:hypothetical protein